MNDVPFFINMPIPAHMFTAVCALLAGTASAAVSSAPAPGNAPASDVAPQDTGNSSGTDATLGQESPASAGTGETATTDASPSDGAIDAHGHPWSAELHASTMSTTKDGLWRMKVGVSRPDPLPGFPAANGAPTPDTGTSSGTEAPSATLPAATNAASAPNDTSGDDDEFAAFRTAAAASDAGDAAAAAAAPTAREWTDADLGALCNQAAVKLGDPSPVKALIAQHVPEGEVAHSRNIPADKREDFAKAVEAGAGIEFVG